MATEIERKFLVSGAFPDGKATEIVQIYLSLDPQRTIRVRIESGKATFNIKGKTEGITRTEFEYPIPLPDAWELLKLAIGSPIEKTRHRISHGAHTWEVDVFHGANQGLIVAEIELASESQSFEKPAWVGEEVSTDFRYTNASLATHPFQSW